MLGPFGLKYHHLFVNTTSAGAFILSRNGRVADYVGVAAEELAATIGRFARQTDYRYFWFQETASAAAATELEQAWVHRYRPTDNPTPAMRTRPNGWRCTTEGCATCALTEFKV